MYMCICYTKICVGISWTETTAKRLDSNELTKFAPMNVCISRRVYHIFSTWWCIHLIYTCIFKQKCKLNVVIFFFFCDYTQLALDKKNFNFVEMKDNNIGMKFENINCIVILKCLQPPNQKWQKLCDNIFEESLFFKSRQPQRSFTF